jgi:sigma-B regulation protein RsbU (phosphoserine phosphatase)
MSDADIVVLTQSPSGVVAFTEDGTIISANSYCHSLLEFDDGELNRVNVSDLFTVAGKIFYQTHFYPMVKLHKHAEEIFLNLQTKCKKEVPVVLNAIVTPFKDQNIVICSFIQVLNRGKYESEILLAKKNAEEALRKNEVLEKVRRELELKQKELDKQINLLKSQNSDLLQLGNIITHDLQEPVRKLIMFSYELLEGNLEGAKIDRALSVIKKSSEKVKNLLLNLQEYLNLTMTGEEKGPVNLEEVVREELLRLQKDYPEINLKAQISPLPVIIGSVGELRLMFYHLLENSFIHGTAENNLDLRIDAVIIKDNLFSSSHDKFSYIDYVKITIKDQGPGFENQYKEYIFDFLKKLNLSDNTTGLGLTFCRKIAEKHFGVIKAEAAAGMGATFTIILPVGHVY